MALALAAAAESGRHERPVRGRRVDHGLQPRLRRTGPRPPLAAREHAYPRGGGGAGDRRGWPGRRPPGRYTALRAAARPTARRCCSPPWTTGRDGAGSGRRAQGRARGRHDPVRRTWLRRSSRAPRHTGRPAPALGVTSGTTAQRRPPVTRSVRTGGTAAAGGRAVRRVAEALARRRCQLRDDSRHWTSGRAARETSRRRRRGRRAGRRSSPAYPASVRRRVTARWLRRGVPELTDAQLRRADELLGRWRAGRDSPCGELELTRAHGRLVLGPRSSAWASRTHGSYGMARRVVRR